MQNYIHKYREKNRTGVHQCFFSTYHPRNWRSTGCLQSLWYFLLKSVACLAPQTMDQDISQTNRQTDNCNDHWCQTNIVHITATYNCKRTMTKKTRGFHKAYSRTGVTEPSIIWTHFQNTHIWRQLIACILPLKATSNSWMSITDCTNTVLRKRILVPWYSWPKPCLWTPTEVQNYKSHVRKIICFLGRRGRMTWSEEAHTVTGSNCEIAVATSTKARCAGLAFSRQLSSRSCPTKEPPPM